MTRNLALPVVSIVEEHTRQAAFLWSLRCRAINQTNYNLLHLGKLDRRIEAHLDGMSLGGERAWHFSEAALADPSVGDVFAMAVRAIPNPQSPRFDRLFSLAARLPGARWDVMSACGWLAGEDLKGVVAKLLGAEDDIRRLVGVAACGMHRVDPGLISARRVCDPSAVVRARALRTAGEIGLDEALSACAGAVDDEDPECQFWATWSAVLLGNRGKALNDLTRLGLQAGAHRRRAFQLSLQATSQSRAHSVLQELANGPANQRWLVHGAGIVGDPTYTPWLIGQMQRIDIGRTAGEAFSLIAGIDLALLDLERKPPENLESGPNDDPDDPNVDMDEDDGLPWPDPQKIEKWWAANGSRFQKGTRYFMGAPVTREHCIEVLKNGYQRQRILAAHYLCLLEPGTPLFNTSAPAWRQQRLLAKMT
jgi:uncharacterized protein (TIGR02270 family)